jgi:PKD domain.
MQQISAVLENTNSTQWRLNLSVFDPTRQSSNSFSTGWFEAYMAWRQTNAGVVLWETQPSAGSSVNRVYFAVYDPRPGSWQVTNKDIVTTRTTSFTDGAIGLWIESGTFFNATIYDPVLQKWVFHREGPYSVGSLNPASFGGFVSILDTHGATFYVYAWMFDPLLHDWRTTRLGPYSSSTPLVTVQSGSLKVKAGSQTYLNGYDYITGTWVQRATTALPLFQSSRTASTLPASVVFTDLSLGVDHWYWSFGDGTPDFTGRCPIHTFTKPGTNLVTLAASSTIYGLGGATNGTFIGRRLPSLALRKTGAEYGIEVSAAEGTLNMIESSTNLADWHPLSLVSNATETVMATNVPATAPLNFYRIHQLQDPLIDSDN